MTPDRPPVSSVRFIDHAILLCTAGRGGQGCRSQYRDLWMRHARPDGGDGGDGGDVILVADQNVPTLQDCAYRKHVSARSGSHGSSKRQQGARGASVVVPVPPGTVVYDEDTGELLQDLAVAGDRLVVARGGRGGVGNAKAREITLGEPGEECRARLELKLVADVGIVGLPNAGKSTLLRALSAARPRVAAYPFTTTAPTLGVLVRLPAVTHHSDDALHGGSRRRAEPVPCVAVDVPGLIAGAAQGRGLGLAFLRHIERTRVLLHVVDLAGGDGRDPVEDVKVLQRELTAYDPSLAAKPQLLVANKRDLPEGRKALPRFRRLVRRPVVAISAKTGAGVPALLTAVARLLVSRVEP